MGYNEKMFGLGNKRSVIREIFEYSKIRSSQIGAENVFDFSLGNPSVPAPDCVVLWLSPVPAGAAHTAQAGGSAAAMRRR